MRRNIKAFRNSPKPAGMTWSPRECFSTGAPQYMQLSMVVRPRELSCVQRMSAEPRAISDGGLLYLAPPFDVCPLGALEAPYLLPDSMSCLEREQVRFRPDLLVILIRVQAQTRRGSRVARNAKGRGSRSPANGKCRACCHISLDSRKDVG